MMNEIFCILVFGTKPSKCAACLVLKTFRFGPATLQMLSSHMWLPYWTVQLQTNCIIFSGDETQAAVISKTLQRVIILNLAHIFVNSPLLNSLQIAYFKNARYLALVLSPGWEYGDDLGRIPALGSFQCCTGDKEVSRALQREEQAWMTQQAGPVHRSNSSRWGHQQSEKGKM